MDDQTCIANIGTAQRRRRFWPGVISLALGVGHGVAVAALSLTPALLVPAAVLLFAGFTGVLQARDETCVALASRGLRDLGSGPERIESEAELAAVRVQARRVLLKSLGATALVCGMLLLALVV